MSPLARLMFRRLDWRIKLVFVTSLSFELGLLQVDSEIEHPADTRSHFLA